MAIFHFLEGKHYEYQELLERGPTGSAGLRRADGLSERAETIPFVNIGLNRPLTVEIRHIYLGDLLPNDRRRRRKSILVTSAMKSVAQYNAEPRAINFLSREIGNDRHFSVVDATQSGTPIVYHSPALTQPASVLTIELGFDDFDGDLFEQTGEMLKLAGSLPIFLDWGGYLFGAGNVIKIASRFLERFKERGPAFRVHDTVNFVTPGGLVPMAGFRVLGGIDLDGVMREGFAPDPDGVLVNADGDRYEGPVPYLTISLDGTSRDDLLSFEPKQASAAVLSDIFAIRTDQSADVTLIIDSLKLLNDLKFRRAADQIRTDIERLGDDPTDQERAAQLEDKYEAMVKNICQEELRP